MLVVMLGLAVSLAAVGVLGHLLVVTDSVMLLFWLTAGVLYYQMLRFPRAAVAAVRWVRRPHAPELVGDLSTGEYSPSEET
jgi:hypothetical protein